MILLNVICAVLVLLESNSVNGDAKLRESFLPFSRLTNQFLSTVQPNYAMNITKLYINNIIGTQKISTDPKAIINEYWKTYVGYLILFILGLLFIFIFTCSGFCLCCCRCCCGRCGSKPTDKEGSKRRRTILITLLFIFTSMIFIGAVVSMASNKILADAINGSNSTTDKDGNIFGNLDTSLEFATSYLNELANNGFTKGTSVLKDTVGSIVSALYSSSDLFMNAFFSKINFSAIINETNAATTEYISLASQMTNLSQISALHKNKTMNFNESLNDIVQRFQNLLNENFCMNNQSDCQRVKGLLPTLVLGYNYFAIIYQSDIALADVVHVDNISGLINATNKVSNRSQELRSQANATFAGYITNFSTSVQERSSIFQYINNTISLKDDALSFLGTYKNLIYSAKIGNGKSLSNGGLFEYYRYIFYGLIVLISFILCIVLLFFIGLCFAICRIPNSHGPQTCKKRAGNTFLMCGIALSFLFGWLIMLVVILLFNIGGPIQTEGCRYVTNTDKKALVIIDEIINTYLNKSKINFPLQNISMHLPNVNIMQSLLLRCPTSNDLISAFEITPEYINSFSINIFQQYVSPHMDGMTSQMNEYQIDNMDFSAILNNINLIFGILYNVTTINSSSTITELNKPVIRNFSTFTSSTNDLYNASKSSSVDFAKNVTTIVTELQKTYGEMTDIHSSYLRQKVGMTPAIMNILAQLTSLNGTIAYLPTAIPQAKNSAVNVVVPYVINMTQTSINSSIFTLLSELGNCQGLARTFNSLVGIVCTTLLVPLNNLWMGMGLFLLFIIPAIIVALKLHRLYHLSSVDPKTPSNNKVFERSSDLELIRMVRPRKI